ncbi:signal peptidase II [Egbenema bharatensis]|uniref:signal peptidase II n=1 Tax=Egbenema bharatensis TaxID=3463334 RepID=UPI003A894C67
MRTRNLSIKNQLFWVAAAIGLILDQLTKLWVDRVFELGETLPLWEGVFHFTYVTNPGAAFSWFSEQGEWLRWLSLLVSVGLVVLAWFGPRMDRWEQVGYGCVLAGALGNGIDRFRLGEVIDFLDFRLINFPVFNIADICINIGILCLLIAAFKPNPTGNGKHPPR